MASSQGDPGVKQALIRSVIVAGLVCVVLNVGCAPVGLTTELPSPPATKLADDTITLPTETAPTTTTEPGDSTGPTVAAATLMPAVRSVRFEEVLAEVDFTLPLTIQHISQTGAWLYFEFEFPSEGELFYWVDGRDEQGVYSIELSAESLKHLVELTDLLPDTQYRIRVGLPGEGGAFRSPGLNGEDWGETILTTYPTDLEHMRVAVIGDSGFGESITYALVAQMAAQDPDFVIHTGDLVYSAFENGSPLRAYQAKYFWPFQKVLLQAPVYAVPGNHEYYDDASIGGEPYYFSVFPQLREHVLDGSWVGTNKAFRNWYAVRMMDYQFVFLDSQKFYREAGAEEENEWLRAILADHSGPNMAVYHIATYTSGRHERDGLPIQQAWLPYFHQADTAVILSGHDHNYERLKIDGLEYIVSGGGSAKLYALDQPVAGSQVFAAESHFVMLDIFPDHIDIEVLNAFGDILDRTTLDSAR